VRRILRERVLATLAIVGLLSLATALLRNPARVGLSSDYQWGLKLAWRGRADCVLAGDSRVAYSLSPQQMSGMLDGQRVLNFAFPFGMYTDDYLDAIEAVLDPAAAQPTILLGVTARALVPVAQTEDGNGFERLRSEAAERHALGRFVLTWLPFSSPLRVDHLWRELNPWAAGEPLEVRYPDGWTAQAPPLDAGYTGPAKQRQLRYYTRLYAHATVDRAAIERVLSRVQAWSAGGIRVYGWRPPTDADLRALENRLSGFDEDAFARRFEAAGGVWIPVVVGSYVTYDGSHLHRASAESMSRYIAGWIQEAERSHLVRR
jgi:hypothetical protein